MPFDGITVSSLAWELNNTILYGKIEKIYQPEKDELIITIRKDKENHRLQISAGSTFPRLHLSDEKKSNPLAAPPFCMLLRKHITGSRIAKIAQISMDRVLEIQLECLDEMGYRIYKSLMIEIMGRHSNIIFINSQSRIIIDSIKRINTYISSVRVVLPGVEYSYPPAADKANPIAISEKTFEDDIASLKGSIKANKYLVQKFYGISPIVSQEICYISAIDPDTDLKNSGQNTVTALYKGLKEIMNKIIDTKYNPQIIADGSKNIDFTVIDLNVYSSYEKSYFITVSEAIQTYYASKDKQDRAKQKTYDLHKVITNRLMRNVRKLEILQNEYEESKKSEYYKLCGNLIMSNMYVLDGNKEKLYLPDYNNPEELIEVALDAKLTPIQNAQKYFKMYNKSKKALKLISIQIDRTKDDIQYLDSILESLEKAYNDEEIDEIKLELYQEGYIKRLNNKNSKPTKKPMISKVLHFKSSANHDIYVGKNNIQNDYLTLKFADFNDLWLHAKDIHGSHVIVKTKGIDIDETTLIEAATLAAYYSKGKLSSNVPIDYTFKKYVKKPTGSKPGKVIYENHKTIYVTPSEEKVKEMTKTSLPN